MYGVLIERGVLIFRAVLLGLGFHVHDCMYIHVYIDTVQVYVFDCKRLVMSLLIS